MDRMTLTLRLVHRFAIALAVAVVVQGAPAAAGNDHLQLTAPKAPSEAAFNLQVRRTAIAVAAGRHSGSH